jgi:hypothetical protein
VFGTGTPFAIQGAFSGAFGRAEIAGGGTISITDAALTFTFQPDPPAVPAPIPEPGTLLVVASGLAFISRMRSAAGRRTQRAASRQSWRTTR